MKKIITILFITIISLSSISADKWTKRVVNEKEKTINDWYEESNYFDSYMAIYSAPDSNLGVILAENLKTFVDGKRSVLKQMYNEISNNFDDFIVDDERRVTYLTDLGSEYLKDYYLSTTRVTVDGTEAYFFLVRPKSFFKDELESSK